MIGKTTLSNNFQATLRYVYGKPNATVLVASFAGYHDPLLIAKSMAQVAGDRSEKPCYHISLSPAPGDRLEMMDWYGLSQDFLEALGASTHQYVGVLHTDTTYPDGQSRPHLHLVINRYRMGSSLDRALCLHFPQIEQVIRKLEQDYQLEATPCSWDVRRGGEINWVDEESQDSEHTQPLLNQPQITPSEPLEQKLPPKKRLRRQRQAEAEIPQNRSKSRQKTQSRDRDLEL